MGKRLNISQPVVINTELQPLTDLFEIVVTGGSIEQWYYVNDDLYKQDRELDPITLTPTIEAYDGETGIKYNPTLYITAWYVTEYNTTTNQYAERQIEIGETYYVLSNSDERHTLVVRKNVECEHPVTIRSVASYIDPRDSATTIMVEATVSLITNQESSVVFPQVVINNPSLTLFNPITMVNDTEFTFSAKAFKGTEDVSSQVYFEWFAADYTGLAANQTPSVVNITSLPCYTQTTQPVGKGQGTDTIKLNAMYTEKLYIVCRIKESQASLTYYPQEATRTLMWDYPNVEVKVLPLNGGAVRSFDTTMSFKTIVSMKGRDLTDAEKSANMLFEWKRRKTNASTVYDQGWGAEITISAEDLRNTRPTGNSDMNVSFNTQVYPITYWLGALEKVTHNNEAVTHNGEQVYCRYY